ncbi:MAG: RNA methyltransferase [Terriglobia bacterium]
MSAAWLKWRVILVRPRNPLNIGASARAMANFGFKDLVVVEPYGPVWRETRSAVGAEEIVRAARATPSLAEAISDRTLVVGTTSGQRRALDRELMSLGDLPSWVGRRERLTGFKPRAAILFGSEKTGLSNENLSYCHALVRIPTEPHCPSMNLGQAVAVCCYELSRLNRKVPGPQGENSRAGGLKDPRERSVRNSARARVSPPASTHSIEHIFERAARVLDAAGYLKPKSREAQLLKLRRALIERRLSSRDAKILGGLLAQIEWRLGHP